MTLLTGTLADLDLPSIARVTSLGRSSLRLELRASSGDLIGSLVLKAGRVVSATAGGTHGRDALRVLMSSASDVRFQLAREPLDFALSSALASVDELVKLARGSTGMPRSVTSSGDGSRALRPSAHHRRVPSPARVQMMQGRLDEFDLLTLLQTIGLGRQLVEIEIRDRSGTALGAVGVKSGKIVSAHAGDTAGVDAISLLIGSPESFQFAVFRIAADVGPVPELVSVSEISIRLAQAVMNDLHPAPVQQAPVQQAPAQLAPAQPAPAQPAAAPVQFAPVQQAPVQLAPAQLAPAQLAPAQPSPAPARSPSAVMPTHVDHIAPPITAGEVLMEGSLSDFDLGTLLQGLAATRQYARVLILDRGPSQFGDITLKAGWILSSQAGGLHGTRALAFLLKASTQLRFRVVTGLVDLESQQPLGSIHELLTALTIGGTIGGTPRSEPQTRVLRWVIPVSFVVGGAIVFLVLRGWSTSPPHHGAPIEMTTIQAPAGPIETPAPPARSSEAPVPRAPAEPPAQAAPPGQAAAPPARPIMSSASFATPAPSAIPPPPAKVPAPPAEAPGLPRGGTSIQTAQSALKRLGYDPGPIDNVFGQLTRNAVIQFQQSQHLPVTGILDQETWSAIVSRLAP